MEKRIERGRRGKAAAATGGESPLTGHAAKDADRTRPAASGAEPIPPARGTSSEQRAESSGARRRDDSGPSHETDDDRDVVVVRRRERDNGERLRRGSLKSRIFQFKKRKKKEGDGKEHQEDKDDKGRQGKTAEQSKQVRRPERFSTPSPPQVSPRKPPPEPISLPVSPVGPARRRSPAVVLIEPPVADPEPSGMMPQYAVVQKRHQRKTRPSDQRKDEDAQPDDHYERIKEVATVEPPRSSATLSDNESEKPVARPSSGNRERQRTKRASGEGRSSRGSHSTSVDESDDIYAVTVLDSTVEHDPPMVDKRASLTTQPPPQHQQPQPSHPVQHHRQHHHHYHHHHHHHPPPLQQHHHQPKMAPTSSRTGPVANGHHNGVQNGAVPATNGVGQLLNGAAAVGRPTHLQLRSALNGSARPGPRPMPGSSTDLIPIAQKSHQPPTKEVEVVLRMRKSRPSSVVSTNQDPGRLLKSALARHFRNLHCGVSHTRPGSTGGSTGGETENYNSVTVLSLGLDQYIREVFQQLDHKKAGYVSREDFETLCEVLELSKSPPQSVRNSGLEWLAAYRPRPNSPGSPLRLDRLSEVKYKPPPGSRPSSTATAASPTSFLWTLGPRPFWELWPQKKRRKKQLNLDEFTRFLIEQWAKTHGYPLPSFLTASGSCSSGAESSEGTASGWGSGPAQESIWSKLSRQISQLHTSQQFGEGSRIAGETDGVGSPTDDTRSRRLMRSIVRVSRRYHVIDRLSRRLATTHDSGPHDLGNRRPPANGATNGNGRAINGNAHHNGRGPLVNGGRSPDDRRVPPLPGQELAGVNAVLELTERPEPCGLGRRSGRQRASMWNPRRWTRSHGSGEAGIAPGGGGGRLRLEKLERHVLLQQSEISSLREVVEDLRNSLQLSDAQNLALQVLLKKMSKAEESGGRKEMRSQMMESEKQLENLVRELKEMSEMVYPTMSSQLSSSCNGHEDEDSHHADPHGPQDHSQHHHHLHQPRGGLDSHYRHAGAVHRPRHEMIDEATEEEEKEAAARMASERLGRAAATPDDDEEEDRIEREFFDSLRSTSHELEAAQAELRQTALKLRAAGREGSVGRKLAHTGHSDWDMREALAALQKAEEEIQELRRDLELAQETLQQSQRELAASREQLRRTETDLEANTNKLSIAEKRVSQLSQNRRSLLLELQSTKEVLLSSLNKVQDLELESNRVPLLEARIQELERKLSAKRYLVRPLSTIDSGLYSTSDSEVEQDRQAHPTEAISDEDMSSSPRDGAHGGQGLPPRPPSSRSRDKSPRSVTPSSLPEKSPRAVTPSSSSGHHSGPSSSSKLSSGSSLHSRPSPGSASAEPLGQDPSGDTSKSSSVIARLRKEIELLKRKFNNAEKDWSEERNCLLDELIRRREDYGEMSSDIQVLEAERVRLSLLEEKIKEVLNMLRTLNGMKISQKCLGRLVVDAVEQSIDPVQGEIQVFKFLNYLYHSTRDYEKMAADRMLARALEAVEESDSSATSNSSDSLGNIPEGMGTIRPRRSLLPMPPTTDSASVGALSEPAPVLPRSQPPTASVLPAEPGTSVSSAPGHLEAAPRTVFLGTVEVDLESEQDQQLYRIDV